MNHWCRTTARSYDENFHTEPTSEIGYPSTVLVRRFGQDTRTPRWT